jgi:hypothetical protein
MKRRSKAEMARVIQSWLAQPYIPTDSEPHTIPMQDPTENARRARQAELNNEAGGRQLLEDLHGQVWSTDELRASQYEVIGFMAPYVVVRDKVTGKKGSLEFQHSPRFYFSYRADE